MNVVRISDGLGNQIFQYAFARKLKIVTGRNVYLDTRFINNEDIKKRKEASFVVQNADYREYGLDKFKISIPKASETILKKWEYINKTSRLERLLCCMNKYGFAFWRYEDENEVSDRNIIFRKRPTYYKGYFFDLKYYEDIRGILQKELRLRKPICIKGELKKIYNQPNTVSLHIRRGDFVRLSRDIGKRGYYQKAMKRMNELVEQPVYMVFSDDIEWVKQNMEFDGKCFYVSDGGLKDYEEFALMRKCKHNIIADSTFSYWAAYLNDNPDKIVICPRYWRRKIIPKEWIEV